ncbi:HAD hydrolase-like protein [Streptomyces sp. SID8379]|uniref:HAD family hydrolase n=1 Tax=unclassified Streptomyces TaxID=2593676 RepID=UPI0009960D31|nr:MULTISPECIES: HAD family hydrolase [unclassified Streptomyces]MYW67852.1 HAD hydrolase-like protein [Streptomyces sp. SID8379]
MVRRALGNHHLRPDTLLVTSDVVKQTDAVTDSVAEETEPHGELTGLVRRARYVLFDFDGPICRLFAGRPADLIAREQVDWLDAQGLGEALTAQERVDTDPHSALRSLGLQRPRSDLVVEMEKRLTAEELRAVPTAWPTPYADPLIRTWTAMGARLAITTNNSPEVARRYLEGRGLSGCFHPHVYGRTQDLTRLKPDPYCLHRALNAMGAAPASALMIGDTPTDYLASRAAGVEFLGYARNERKAGLLRDAGARVLVGSLEPVLGALRAAR